MIDKLRTYHGSDWTDADENGAIRVLKYCRARGSGELDNDPEWDFVVEFFCDFGQSFDWVFRGDPVSMVAAMAERSRRGKPSWVRDMEARRGQR
jgi:hypothetical protein